MKSTHLRGDFVRLMPWEPFSNPFVILPHSECPASTSKPLQSLMLLSLAEDLFSVNLAWWTPTTKAKTVAGIGACFAICSQLWIGPRSFNGE
jgi:hypothetical protein